MLLRSFLFSLSFLLDTLQFEWNEPLLIFMVNVESNIFLV